MVTSSKAAHNGCCGQRTTFGGWHDRADRPIGPSRGPVAAIGVHNAGYAAYGPLEFMPMDVLRRQMDVNIMGLLEVTQAVLPGMRQQRTSRTTCRS